MPSNHRLYSTILLYSLRLKLSDDVHVGVVDQFQQGLEDSVGEVNDLNNLPAFFSGSEIREVNPYKIDQGVHPFLFISDENIVKQSKISMLQNNILK